MVIPLTVGFLSSCLSIMAIQMLSKNYFLAITAGILIYEATPMLTLLILYLKELSAKKL